MKKLRWAMDGGFWELDMSTPTTLDGVARAVPDDPLPLGLSRGTRLARSNQIDFLQCFMSMPFVPSSSISTHGLSLQRVFTIPFADNWFVSLLGQFNFQKFVSSVKEGELLQPSKSSSWLQGIGRHFSDKSLYALGLSSEFLITPDDALVVSLEGYGDNKTPRQKAAFRHKFLNHNLMVEAVWPGLFVDKLGTYWDVPLSMAIDLASVASDTGASYHLSLLHNTGLPKQFDGEQTHDVPATLLPGLCAKGAFALKKNIDLWRSKAKKLKMVQPFDAFLSNPHISLSGVIGAVGAACLGDNSVRVQESDELLGFKGFRFCVPRVKSALLADMFASVSFTAQYGNFQKLFLDLTRLCARLDFPSGSKFLAGTARLTQDLYNSQQPSVEVFWAICPTATLSLQQQIAGPFSFRIDSGVAVDLKNREWHIDVKEPVFAIEYALQVLGSAKAVAWYSPKHQEFMVELSFFEI